MVEAGERLKCYECLVSLRRLCVHVMMFGFATVRKSVLLVSVVTSSDLCLEKPSPGSMELQCCV